MNIVSWNVNGIRAATKNGIWTWFDDYQPDMFFLQEIKATASQLSPEILNRKGYHSYLQPAEKKGYSGVAAFVKKKPAAVKTMGIPQFDSEGRVQILEYPDFSILNAYFPNSQEKGKRLDYKLDFCREILNIAGKYRKKGRNLIICGDYNIAHKPIDLKNPGPNEKNPGYLPEERKWMDTFIAAGYTDTFRLFEKGPGHYTWWSYRFQARTRNIGWRIDYHCVNSEFEDHIKGSEILPEVPGSDHCPIVLKI